MSDIDAMETERLAERIASGLEQVRKNGKERGRKKGSVKTDEQLLKDYPGAVRDLKTGLSKRKVAKLHHLARATVDKIANALLIKI
jgi:DNA invertase Pin-like site-specific DNA recombinase